MKFKVTENDVSLLEQRFILALEKMAKSCHLYLTADHAIFLHNLLNDDGIQSIAQFRKEALFDDYRISSQNDDRIDLLHRPLPPPPCPPQQRRRLLPYIAASVANPNRLQIKLVKKLPPNSTNPTPFLTFETSGFKSAVIQDILISNWW